MEKLVQQGFTERVDGEIALEDDLQLDRRKNPRVEVVVIGCWSNPDRRPPENSVAVP